MMVLAKDNYSGEWYVGCVSVQINQKQSDKEKHSGRVLSTIAHTHCVRTTLIPLLHL